MPRPSRTAPLDRASATRILDGDLDAADAPPGYGPVVTLLTHARAPARAFDLAHEAAARSALRVARRAPARGAGPAKRWHGARLAVLVTAVTVALGGIAAAATGSLPGPAQSVAHGALGAVGVPGPAPSVPTPAVRKASPPPSLGAGRPPPASSPRPPRLGAAVSPPPPTRLRPTPTAPRPASTGARLCRAVSAGRLEARRSPAEGAAFRRLITLAGGAAQIPSYCRSQPGAAP